MHTTFCGRRDLSLSLTVSGPITAPSYEVQTGTAGFGSELIPNIGPPIDSA